MKMQLRIDALLLILAALQDHTTAADTQIYPLDMALNSVDDQYKNCAEETAKKVKDYLDIERKNPEFNKNWQEGEKHVKTKGDLTREHLIALYVYTNGQSDVYRMFNTATRNEKLKYRNGEFQWYSLHFLLTEAVQILKKGNDDSLKTYRGTNLQFKAKVGDKVRLGSFTSSSFDKKIALKYGNQTCFEIQTSKGAPIESYSKFPEEKEVLIPPYEKFEIFDVKDNTIQKDLWCKTVFYLKSSGTQSVLNCAMFPELNATL